MLNSIITYISNNILWSFLSVLIYPPPSPGKSLKSLVCVYTYVRTGTPIPLHLIRIAGMNMGGGGYSLEHGQLNNGHVTEECDASSPSSH